MAHRKVREARLDAYHELALRLVRDTQAVSVDDLTVSGLAHPRLATSVHDAGWATLVRLLEEKVVRYRRTVVKVSRWFPSSQRCSACGHDSGVRVWICTSCGTEHDRDLNAARNILAGPAETPNACGPDVRLGPVPAVGAEAGTR